MPSFQDSFWTGDYSSGIKVLFDKLNQGVVENEQVLTMARMRADAEETYSRKLSDVAAATDRMTGGFARDDGASLRKVRIYIAIRFTCSFSGFIVHGRGLTWDATSCFSLGL
jgi:Fes/CIP4, and EFC/F-BAR homology domain